MPVLNIQTNFDEVASKFKDLNTDVMDATEPLRAFGAIIQKDIADQFETEGQQFGSGWPPLSHKSLLRRMRKNMRAVERKFGKGRAHGLVGQEMAGEVPILRDTGALFGSIRELDVSPRHVTIGTDLIYGATHNYGAIERNIPQRQFIPEFLSEEEERALMELFDTWLQDAVERSGLN